MASVEIQSIAKRYGEVIALDDINLQVAEGEFLTLLGPSGSGKSTLLNMIAGLSTPDAGTIRIGGKDVTHIPSSDRNIGIVFQSYALFPHMTVFDNVAFPLRVRGKSKSDIQREVTTTLARVKLQAYAGRKPGELSGGQHQRVALARAMVFKPSILLLDEPLGALDKNLREELQFELRELQQSVGITTIMVTHDQEEAMSLSDRIAVFNSGRIEQIGEPREIYKSPSNQFVANFFGLNNIFKGVRLSDGAPRLKCDDGLLIDVPGAAESAAGKAVEFMIRPEAIRLASPAEANALSGRVIGCVYLGASVRYRVELPGGRILAVESSGSDPVYAVHESIGVAWALSDLTTLDAK